jgi:hypothetical protein
MQNTTCTVVWTVYGAEQFMSRHNDTSQFSAIIYDVVWYRPANASENVTHAMSGAEVHVDTSENLTQALSVPFQYDVDGEGKVVNIRCDPELDAAVFCRWKQSIVVDRGSRVNINELDKELGRRLQEGSDHHNEPVYQKVVEADVLGKFNESVEIIEREKGSYHVEIRHSEEDYLNKSLVPSVPEAFVAGDTKDIFPGVLTFANVSAHTILNYSAVEDTVITARSVKNYTIRSTATDANADAPINATDDARVFDSILRAPYQLRSNESFWSETALQIETSVEHNASSNRPHLTSWLETTHKPREDLVEWDNGKRHPGDEIISYRFSDSFSNWTNTTSELKSRVIPYANPVSCYSFDGHVLDSKGSATQFVVGSLRYDLQRGFDYAAKLDGYTYMVVRGGMHASSTRMDFSLLVSIKANSTHRGPMWVVGSCSSDGYMLVLHRGLAYFRSGCTLLVSDRARNLTDGRWHQLGIVLPEGDRCDGEMYVDGESHTTSRETPASWEGELFDDTFTPQPGDAEPFDCSTALTNVSIGIDGRGSIPRTSPYVGQINALCFYNVTLTSAQVKTGCYAFNNSDLDTADVESGLLGELGRVHMASSTSAISSRLLAEAPLLFTTTASGPSTFCVSRPLRERGHHIFELSSANHSEDAISWFVVETGEFLTDQDSEFRTGRVAQNQSRASHSFDRPFPHPPAFVMAQQQSSSCDTCCGIKVHNITAESFDLVMTCACKKGVEIGYVALESAVGTVSGLWRDSVQLESVPFLVVGEKRDTTSWNESWNVSIGTAWSDGHASSWTRSEAAIEDVKPDDSHGFLWLLGNTQPLPWPPMEFQPQSNDVNTHRQLTSNTPLPDTGHSYCDHNDCDIDDCAGTQSCLSHAKKPLHRYDPKAIEKSRCCPIEECSLTSSTFKREADCKPWCRRPKKTLAGQFWGTSDGCAPACNTASSKIYFGGGASFKLSDGVDTNTVQPDPKTVCANAKKAYPYDTVHVVRTSDVDCGGPDNFGATFGIVCVAGEHIVDSIELPWRENRVCQSSVNEGSYTAEVIEPRIVKTGYEFEIALIDFFVSGNEHGRTGILLHGGKYIGNTDGCILIGKGHDPKCPKLESSLTNEHMRALLEAVCGKECYKGKQFSLRIVNVDTVNKKVSDAPGIFGARAWVEVQGGVDMSPTQRGIFSPDGTRSTVRRALARDVQRTLTTGDIFVEIKSHIEQSIHLDSELTIDVQFFNQWLTLFELSFRDIKTEILNINIAFPELGETDYMTKLFGIDLEDWGAFFKSLSYLKVIGFGRDAFSSFGGFEGFEGIDLEWGSIDWLQDGFDFPSLSSVMLKSGVPEDLVEKLKVLFDCSWVPLGSVKDLVGSKVKEMADSMCVGPPTARMCGTSFSATIYVYGPVYLKVEAGFTPEIDAGVEVQSCASDPAGVRVYNQRRLEFFANGAIGVGGVYKSLIGAEVEVGLSAMVVLFDGYDNIRVGLKIMGKENKVFDIESIFDSGNQPPYVRCELYAKWKACVLFICEGDRYAWEFYTGKDDDKASIEEGAVAQPRQAVLCPGIGANLQQVCDGAGSCLIGSAACICDPGFYQDRYTGLSCTPCPPGYAAPDSGNSRCYDCFAGSFAEPGSIECALCQPGSWSAARASECIPCEMGTAISLYGATECGQCAEGKFSPMRGASECTLCRAGKYTPLTGSGTCYPCSAGSSSDEGASRCFPCYSGTSSVEGGLCVRCNAGWYQPSIGADQCLACASGSAQPEVGMGRCVECMPGTFQS